METDKDHMYFSVSYTTTDKVCYIVKIIKQETTHCLWVKYNSFLSKQYWKKHIFWFAGYFDCSIGEMTTERILFMKLYNSIVTGNSCKYLNLSLFLIFVSILFLSPFWMCTVTALIHSYNIFWF